MYEENNNNVGQSSSEGTILSDKGNHKPLYVTLLAVVACIVMLFGGYFGYTFYMAQNNTETAEPVAQNVLLEGVPAYNIYTYQGEGSILGPGVVALASVFKYWDPETNFWEVEDGLKLALLPLYESLDVVADVAAENGYNARIEYLTLDDAAQYLDDQKTPLIFALRPNQNPVFKEPMAFPAVLIGIDEVHGTLTFHDYWRGPVYTMKLDEFNERHKDAIQDGERYKMLIVQPRDMVAALDDVASRNEKSYPERTAIMDLLDPLLADYRNGFFLHYAAGWAENEADAEENNRQALAYLLKLVERPEFTTTFPKFFQVSTLHVMAATYLALGENEWALETIQRAAEINDGLDQPEGQWPGVETLANAPEHVDKLAKVDRLMGDIYRELGDKESARAAYERTLEIMPTNRFAIRALEELGQE